MKRFASLGICLFLLNAAVCAAGFEKVFSPNGTDVWAVGNTGNVFRSFDGGATWASTPLGSATLRSVSAVGSMIMIVGDGGACYRSTNNGASFALQTLGGGVALRSVYFLDRLTGWIGGDGGTLLKTNDSGASWNSLSSSTVNAIYAVKFSDANTGWFVGASGLAKVTTDGGASWTSVATGLTKDLYGVDFSGSSVYVSGAAAAVAKSTNSGTSWEKLDFKFDSQSDVNDVMITPGGAVFFCGGGGFIRKSTDGAATFTYPLNPMLGDLRDIFFYDMNKGLACSSKNNAVLRTTDGGTTWLLPTGTTLTTTWMQKLSTTAAVRGNAFSFNAFNKNTIYCALGTSVYASYNRGDTWSSIATLPTGGSKVNSFYVSPKDTNLWVAAYGSTDRIVRTTNRGATWTTTITKNFSEYGMPLEMDGSHPDSLFFGPEDGNIWRSTNFGLTWDSLSHPGFRSPCDLVVVRDNPAIIWVGDGVTGSGQGQMFRSTDGGKNFTLIYSVSGSEIPTIGSSAIDNTIGYATAWGSGGVMKTANLGSSWSPVATTGSTWGADVAKDDPNVAMYGVFGGGLSYLSTNAGASFTTTSLSGSNYAIYCYDRGTFLAQQSGGIYKMSATYTLPAVPVPIQLASFTGRVTGDNRVLLEWTTISEINNYGSFVQRRMNGLLDWWTIENSFVAGHGTTNELQHYSFTDNSAPRASLLYRLKQVDLDGANHFSDPIVVNLLTAVKEEVPLKFELQQNYPNPFNPMTTIAYSLQHPTHVTLTISNSLGQRVATLVNEDQAESIYYLNWNAEEFASGVYFYRLQAGEYVALKKLVLMK